MKAAAGSIFAPNVKSKHNTHVGAQNRLKFQRKHKSDMQIPFQISEAKMGKDKAYLEKLMAALKAIKEYERKEAEKDG